MEPAFEEEKKPEIKKPPEVATESGLMVQDRKGAVLSYRELKDLERETEERIKREYGIVGEGRGREFRSPTSFGTKVEDYLAAKLDNNFLDRLFGPAFGGAAQPKQGGIVSGIMGEPAVVGMLSSFGKGVGDHFGEHVERLAGVFGKGAMLGLAKKAGIEVPEGGNGNENAAKQEQVENLLLKFNPNNTSHVQEFMNMVNSGSGQLNEGNSKQVLMNEQHRILVNRGIISDIPNEVVVKEAAPRDINRQLIDRYDRPNAQPSNFQQNDLFPIQNAGFQQSPEEIVLSMNPDDPISMQQYAALRNISGVDAITIKKMLMAEQRKLLGNMPVTVQAEIPGSVIENKPISPDEDQSRLKGGSPANEFLVEIPPDQKEQVVSPVSTPPPDSSIERQILDSLQRIQDRLFEQDKRLKLLEDKKTEENKETEGISVPVEDEKTPPITYSSDTPPQESSTPIVDEVLNADYSTLEDKDIDVREEVKSEEVKESLHKKKFSVRKKDKEVIDGHK